MRGRMGGLHPTGAYHTATQIYAADSPALPTSRRALLSRLTTDSHMRIQTTHAHNTRQRRMTTKRASTTWLRPGATSTPWHAPPTSPRRHLREPRTKPALLALRAATLTPLQPQRKEEGVAVSLPPLAACRHATAHSPAVIHGVKGAVLRARAKQSCPAPRTLAEAPRYLAFAQISGREGE